MDLRALNPRIFRTLASQPRLRILRALAERPHTPAELARRLGMADTTIAYHLAKMQAAGLAGRRDDGRSRAYHELTPDGRSLVEKPPSAKPLAALAVVLLGVAAALGALWRSVQPEPLPPTSMASPAPAPAWAAWLVPAAVLLAVLASLVAVQWLLARRARRQLAAVQ